MRTLTLEFDELELSTIEAALLLLQEQISALPEDLSDIMRAHGRPLDETEVGKLARRIAMLQGHIVADLSRAETLVEIERAAQPILPSTSRV